VTTLDLDGVIASAGFASGDRVVLGLWDDGPLGPMRDVMWARPDGTRVLLAPDRRVARFITAVYGFDEVHVVPFRGHRDARAIALDAGPVAVRLAAGGAVSFPPRPAWVTRYLEAPVARRVLGVETYGRSPTGVREWYRTVRYRPIRWGRLAVDGVDAGPPGPVRPPLGVGFSEPPARPAAVEVRPRLADVDGRLAAALSPDGTRGGAPRSRR
jgi:hypothetical protein